MLCFILPLLTCICLAAPSVAQEAVPCDAYSDAIVSNAIEDLP